MATYSKSVTLSLIASKLGLDAEDNVLRKAAEFERLLETKYVAGSNLSDISKVVICLDLAANMLGANDFDMKSAMKYCGMRPTVYNNSKKMIQNLLEIDSGKLTTAVLCAALQCTSVQVLADRILAEYQKQAKMEIDLNLPQYVCMAVYHACRISKVRVSKVKLNERAGLKPAQWAKLDGDWAKVIDNNFTQPKKKRGRPAKNKEDNEPEQMEVDTPSQEEMEPKIEPYEDWKLRMIETAYRELRELEKVETKELHSKETPRRSPRKTPQKYSPYKSPKKSNGVRLLFPLL